MNRRRVGIVVALVLMGGCGSSPGQTGPSTSHAASPTGAATAQPSASPGPATSYAAGTYEGVKAHVLSSVTPIRDLLMALGTDVNLEDAVAVASDAAKIQTWAAAEAEWLKANPAAGCYGAIISAWENVRTHALKAADGALAGAFDVMEANFASSQAVKAAEMVTPASC